MSYRILMLAVAMLVATNSLAAKRSRKKETRSVKFVSCGMSDVDATRKEVMKSPTTLGNFVVRRASLGRWWRLLWGQGIDLSTFDTRARKLIYLDEDSPKAPERLDEAYATLERIQADPKKIPEVSGYAGNSPSGKKTDWTMYHGPDGRNTGHTPDPGPTKGKIAWRFPKGYHITAKPVLLDGKVYISSPGADVIGFCLDEKTGKIIWRARQNSFDFYHVRGSTWDPVVTDDRVLYLVGGVGAEKIMVDRKTGKTVSFGAAKGEKPHPPYMAHATARPYGGTGTATFHDAKTSKTAYKCKLDSPPTGKPVVMKNSGFFAMENGKVRRVSIAKRSKKWEVDLETELVGEVEVSDNAVFVGSRAGKLFCLDAKTGKTRWKWQCREMPENALQPLSKPITSGGKTYVGSAGGHVYCLNASTGFMNWKYKTGSWIRSQPAVFGKTVYVATLEGDLIALSDLGTRAKRKGKVRIDEHGFVGDLVTNDKRILLTARNHILYSVSPKTGKVQWKHGIVDGTWIKGEFYACAYSKGLLTTPTLSDGVMYITGPDGFVNAVDARTGEEIWRYEIGYHLSSTPVIAKGMVFVARQSNRTPRFCAFNKKTGKLVWESGEFGPIWVAPVYNKGMLFVGNKYGTMFGIRASDGKKIWEYYTMKDTPLENKTLDSAPTHGWPPGVYSNPAMDDKKVYIGSWSGFYFAFDQKTGKLIWRTATTEIGEKGRPDSAAPVLHKNHLYVQKKGSRIAAIHKDTGKIVWEWKSPSGYGQNGTLAALGDRIYGSVARGVTLLPYHATIIAFNDVETGSKKLWEYDGGGGLTAPVITNKTMITGSSAGMFMTCLDLRTGSVKWRTFTGGVMLENVPTIYGNRAYAHFKNGWIMAFE